MAARPIGTVFNTEDPKLDPTLGGNIESKRSEALSTARSDAILLPGTPVDQEHGGSPPHMDLDGAVAKLPTIREQITWRALFVGLCLGALFSIVTMKLNLQSGVIPGFGLAACMIGFLAIRSMTMFFARISIGDGTYYPQETTIMQTMSNAITDLPFSGGFASFLLSMAPVFYDTLQGTPGVNIADAISPSFKKIMPYQIMIAFIGIFVVLHIRKAFIIDWKLPYPSSRAAGVLIKTMHSKGGSSKVKAQIKALGISLIVAFLWDFFQWWFSGNPDTCTGGFANFPTFGLPGLASSLYGWNFNFELTYPGIGMLCPVLINWSMILGAIVINGIVLPIVVGKEGVWYPAGLGTRNIQGQYAYAVFPTMGFFLAEGLYTIIKVFYISIVDVSGKINAKRKGVEYKPAGKFIGRVIQSSIVPETPEEKALSEHVFIKQAPPIWWATAGYLFFLVLGTIVVPYIYPDAKWYYVLVAYILGPLFGIINAYGAGLTDWNIAGIWAILGICIVSAWAGTSQGAILGSLAVSGIFSGATNAAASITGDFKTGYYTLTSPVAMLIVQCIGECVGLFLAPATFFLFYKGGNRVGEPGSTYQSPFSAIDLGAAAVIYEGIGKLPHMCLTISAIIFFVSLAICVFRDFGPEKFAVWMPSPLAMGIPGIVGAWVAVGMWIGSVIAQIWTWRAKENALLQIVPVATGLITGEGIWAVPQAILSFIGVTPPICMAFFKSSEFGAAAPFASTGRRL